MQARIYRSEVKAGRPVWAILVALVIVVLVSLAANLVGSGFTKAAFWETVVGLLILAGLAPLARSVSVVVQVDEETVSLRCTRFFRATFPLNDVVSIEDGSRVFTGGYGYRVLGKNHRGFIVGGPQATLELTDGRLYTASVPSVESLRRAIPLGS